MLPVGDFSAEDIFQLLAGELFHRIGRVHHYGKGVVGYDHLVHLLSGFFGFHLFAEFDRTGSHGNIRRIIHQCGDADPGASSGDSDPRIRMLIHKSLCCLLGNRQYGVAAFDTLCVGAERQKGKGD